MLAKEITGGLDFTGAMITYEIPLTKWNNSSRQSDACVSK